MGVSNSGYVDPITGKKAEHSKGGFDTKPEAEYVLRKRI